MGYRPGVLLSTLFVCGTLFGCTDYAAEKAKAERTKPVPVVPGPDDADAPREFTTTESGLKYRIRRKSDGKKPDSDQQVVTVHTRGWVNQDDLFDTTYGTAGAPRQSQVSSTLPGYQEGLKLIGEGGMIELEIPSKLAYGEAGYPPFIPPNAPLHFLIELIKVSEPQPLPEKFKGAPSPEDRRTQPGSVDSDAPEEFTTTASGLKYRIRRKSTGKKPGPADSVAVHYRGSLDNGKVFDTSYDLGHPTEFRVNGVIQGWIEGLQLIGEGGMIELEIPSNLAYGPAGHPPDIPPNATLHFLVELIHVR